MDYGHLYEEVKDKFTRYLNSIETQGSVLSQLYYLLKRCGLDLDRQFKWDHVTIATIETQEKNGADRGTEGLKDKEHYWRLLEFANKHQLDNLEDHCYLRLFYLLLYRSFPDKLAHHTNRASQTPGGEELFKLGIHVFVKVSMDWKWLDKPYVKVDNLIWPLASEIEIEEDFKKGCIAFNLFLFYFSSA